VVVGLGVVALVALLAWVVLVGGPTEGGPVVADDEAEDEEWAAWDLEPSGDEAPEDLGAVPPPPPRFDPPDVPGGEARPATREEWRARREQWWSQLSEEERAQWRTRRRGRMEIVPLGPTPANLDEDGVRAALREQFPAMRDCFREAGGFRAMREAMQERGGGGGRPTVRFDVGPDGVIAPGTLSIDPPMPDAFDACVRGAFSSARFGDVGGDGAGVEMQMGRGRRGGSDSLDGGIGRGGRRSGGRRSEAERR
jgi:hypothetical protein